MSISRMTLRLFSTTSTTTTASSVPKGLIKNELNALNMNLNNHKLIAGSSLAPPTLNFVVSTSNLALQQQKQHQLHQQRNYSQMAMKQNQNNNDNNNVSEPLTLNNIFNFNCST